MEFAVGFFSGGFVVGFVAVTVSIRFAGRITRHAHMEAERKNLESRKDAIEFGRDTLPRRGDYEGGESDLFGTLPGAMTKDHLQDSPDFAEPVDLGQDWTKLE